jgi:crotonobetainyl-CoA hydratase
MEILLTGEPFSAQRAHELGFANRVVPLDKLMETAIDLANRISVNAPLSVQASKRIAMGISEGAIASDAAFWEANNREGRVVMQSQDAKEGPLAFAQKRQPVWQAK